jgi:hypothetical protein
VSHQRGLAIFRALAEDCRALKFPSPALFVFLILLSVPHAAVARMWWAAPTALGAKDGSSRENCAGPEALQSILDQLKPGDRLLLGGGEYQDLQLVVRSSGTPKEPIYISARHGEEARPVFISNWTIADPKKGPTAFLLEPGVSHVVFHDLSIRGYQRGIFAPAGKGAASRSGLRFQQVGMDHIRHGFYLSDCSNLTLTGCTLRRYSKHGFRFEAACTNVKLIQCEADCSEADPEWEKQTEDFPFGFVINDGGTPNTDFAFEFCRSRNNLMPLQTTRYKNGDGFVVEGNSERIVFRSCIAVRNQDGGFDLKVKDVQLTDCVAFENKRDFRIWTTGQLQNCYAGWSTVGIWTKGGPVVADQCTIVGCHVSPVDTEDATIGIELRRSLLVSEGSAKPKPAHMKRVTIVESTETELKGAGLQRPPGDWQGDRSVLESTVHSKKGYQTDRK